MRFVTLGQVGELAHAMHYADRHRFTAFGTTLIVFHAFGRTQPNPAAAMTVIVILAFLREKLDGADKTVGIAADEGVNDVIIGKRCC